MPNIPTRQNNPGDLKQGGQIATFNSPADGKAALYNDLTAKMTGTSTTGLNGNSSLIDFSKVYAPAGDNNDPIQYAANLANHLKVSPDTKIGTLIPRIDDFANAVSGNEGYQEKPIGQFVNPQQQTSSTNNFVTPPPQNQPIAPDTSTQEKPDILSNIGSGLQNIGRSIVSPILGAAAIPFQAGLAGYNAITGSNVPDPFAKGIPVAGLGNVPVSPLDLEKKAGDIAQTASYVVPGEGVLGAVGSGVLQGGGSAMSKGGDVAQVATGAGEGAIVGGAAAGATKAIGTGISKFGEFASGETAQNAVNGIKDAYASALNLNASERAFENRSGKDLAHVLTENEAPLGRNEDGTLDASKAIPQLQAKLAPLNQQANQLLSKPQGVVGNVSLHDIQNTVYGKIDAMTLPEADKEDAKKLATSYLASEAKKYGTELSPAQSDKIKQGFWAATFDKNRTNLQNHIPYLLGKSMQDATEKAVAGTDTDVNLHALNQQRGDLIDAIRRLQKMDGVKLLKGGRIGNMVGGGIAAGASAAAGLGPLGVIGGDYFGQKASQFLQDPATKIAIANAKAKALQKFPISAIAGKTLQKAGKGVSSIARPIGLLGNISTQ